LNPGVDVPAVTSRNLLIIRPSEDARFVDGH